MRIFKSIAVGAWIGALGILMLWRPPPPLAVDASRQFAAPSPTHLFGTDRLGRDVFSRTGLALERTLVQAGVAELAGFTTAVVASALVLVQQAKWPPSAAVFRAFMLAVRTLPPFLVALALAVLLRDRFFGMAVALFILSFTFSQPVYEAELAQALKHPAVEGGVSLGAGPTRLLAAYLLPIVLPRLIGYAVLDFASLVAFAALFSFVGLTTPPQPSLGEMLYEARPYITTYPWLFLGPAAVLAALLGGIWVFRPRQQ